MNPIIAGLAGVLVLLVSGAVFWFWHPGVMGKFLLV